MWHNYHGFVRGNPDGTVDPSGPLNRAMAAVLLVNFMDGVPAGPGAWASVAAGVSQAAVSHKGRYRKTH